PLSRRKSSPPNRRLAALRLLYLTRASVPAKPNQAQDVAWPAPQPMKHGEQGDNERARRASCFHQDVLDDAAAGPELCDDGSAAGGHTGVHPFYLRPCMHAPNVLELQQHPRRKARIALV